MHVPLHANITQQHPASLQPQRVLYSGTITLRDPAGLRDGVISPWTFCDGVRVVCGFGSVFVLCTFSRAGTSRPLHLLALSSLKKSYCSWAACMSAAWAESRNPAAGPEHRSGTNSFRWPGYMNRVPQCSGPARRAKPERASVTDPVPATILGRSTEGER
ncbi:hypothetical protein GOODEAATRI_027496 [Goodea atripinnis]|uniref:Uncharacterized protein n=1 Tax=Goodea atripinnis TaxID=208336 RepID=A0ABV0PS55_9TELE